MAKVFCRRCGQEHNTKEVFCPYCGEPTGASGAGLHQTSFEIKDSALSGQQTDWEIAQTPGTVWTSALLIVAFDLLAIFSDIFVGDPTREIFPELGLGLPAILAIDIFLGINLLRGKPWARTLLLIRLWLGLLVWSIFLVFIGHIGESVVQAGVSIGLLLFLTGFSSAGRTAWGLAFIFVPYIGITVLSAGGH